MWPDNETDLDLLNFDGVAATVAELVVQASGRPVSIGISGAWGVGKSSMIKLTKVAFDRHQPKEGPSNTSSLSSTRGSTRATTTPAPPCWR